MSQHGQGVLDQLSLSELRRRTSAKWRTYPEDVLPLWVAEMDVPLAPPIKQAVQDALERGDTGYPYGSGLAEAVAGFARRHWNWDDLRLDQTMLVTDVLTGITEVLRLISEPGAWVISCAPIYPPFRSYVEHAGRRLLVVGLNSAGPSSVGESSVGPNRVGRLDLDALEQAVRVAQRETARPVLLLCNPHNPTGIVHSRAELTALAELAQRTGLRVISDEVHAPLTLPGASFTPYLSVPGTDDAYALYSASKGWNLAGLKAALIIAGAEAAPALQCFPAGFSDSTSHLAVLAHMAAFGSADDWLAKLLTDLDRNRTLLGTLLQDRLPAVSMAALEATYLAWLDCTRLGHPDPARFFLDQAKVALKPGSAFGADWSGFVRLNFATSASILSQAIDQLAAAVHRPDAGDPPS